MLRSYSKFTLLANLRGSGLASASACSRSESLKLARQLSNSPAITDIRPFEYCVEQVRNYDRENYVWLGQTPKDLRPALFAIHAFNVELALIPDLVSQSKLAQIRYQWWREAVTSMKGSAAVNHPVIQALSQVLGDSAAARYKLQRLVSTREQDQASAQPPATLAELAEYADGTAGQVQALQLDVARQKDSNADHAASHLGKAIGITSLLRGTARHAVRRRSYLPTELTALQGVSEEDIYRGRESEGLQNVIFEVASSAKGHLEQARDLIPRLPPGVPGLMLGGVACGLYLSALEKHNFEIFNPALNAAAYTPLRHLLNLKYCSLRGQF